MCLFERVSFVLQTAEVNSYFCDLWYNFCVTWPKRNHFFSFASSSSWCLFSPRRITKPKIGIQCRTINWNESLLYENFNCNMRRTVTILLTHRKCLNKMETPFRAMFTIRYQNNATQQKSLFELDDSFAGTHHVCRSAYTIVIAIFCRCKNSSLRWYSIS